MADTCRRSGAAMEAVWILRSVYPNLLRLIHRRWSKPTATNHSPQAMLSSLASSGRIDNETYKRLREVTVGLGEYGNGGDVRFLIDACRLLITYAQSEAFSGTEAEMHVEAVTEPHTPSRWRQWATAAAALFSIGGAS